MGLSPSKLGAAQPRVGNLEWRGTPVQSCRHPFDSSASPAWHDPFENLLLLERLLGPTCRLLLRIRGVELGAPSREPAQSTSAQDLPNAVALAIPGSLKTQDSGSALRLFAAELPRSVIKAICSVPEWVAVAGPDVLGSLGVISVFVSAVATRASRSARSMWLESVSCERMTRPLGGLSPAPSLLKLPPQLRQFNVEPAASAAQYVATYSNMPLREDSGSRV